MLSECACVTILGDGSVAACSGDDTQLQSRDVQPTQVSECVFAAIQGAESVVADSGDDSSAVQHQPRDVLQGHASEGAFGTILGDGSVAACRGADSSGAQLQLRDVQLTQASECVFAVSQGAESGAQHQLRDRQQTHASEYAFAVALGDDSVVKGHVSSGSDSSGVQLQSRDVQQIQAFNCGDEELSRLTVGNAEQQCPQSVQTSSDLMLDFLTTHSRTPGVQACCDLREFSQTGTFHVTRAPTEVTQLRCRLAASEFDYEAWAELRHKLFMTDVPYELDDDTAVRGLSASCTCLVSLLPPLGFRPRPFGPLGGFVSVPLHASFRLRLRAQPCPHSGDEKLSGLTADYAEQPCLQSAQTSSEPMLDLLTMHSRTPGVQACHDLRMLSQTGIFHVTSTLTETAQLQCTTADSEFDYEAMAEFRRQLLPTEVPYTLDGTQDLPVKIKTLVQKLQLLEVFGRCTNELFRLGHLAHRLNNEVLVVPPPDTVKCVATNLEATQQQLEDGQQAVGEVAATGAVVKSIACLQEFTASVQLAQSFYEEVGIFHAHIALLPHEVCSRSKLPRAHLLYSLAMNLLSAGAMLAAVMIAVARVHPNALL